MTQAGALHAGIQVKDSLILITLLVELGVAAALPPFLARTATFKNLLLNRHRNLRQTLAMLAMICVPLTIGVWIRVRVVNFLAADISFEATILMGLLLGPLPAMLGAAALALPAVWHGEYWALPVNLTVAAIAGTYGRFTDPEDVWSFSPMIDLSLYRWVTRNLRQATSGPADPAAGADYGDAVWHQHAVAGATRRDSLSCTRRTGWWSSRSARARQSWWGFR